MQLQLVTILPRQLSLRSKEKRNAELDEIHEAMKEFCPVVSITDPMLCKDRVEHWAPKMIKLIEDDHASPQMICQGLKIC